ncbi:MAG: protease SohB [Gammaproteobacteria bacterium]|nr:protease SohB [Gammaproteobacteria bacterium]
MEYLIEYGMFLAKSATIVIAILLVIGAITASSRQRKSDKKGVLRITPLNDHFDDLRDELRRNLLGKDELKLIHKQEKKQEKAELKAEKLRLKHSKPGEEPVAAADTRKRRIYVLNFDGDIAAEAVSSLREEISAVLTMAEKIDEVVLRLESPGGMVHAYGLASSQLMRLKNQEIPLTICVDKVAASGGYMMACLADRLIAAPFAILGSIGVLVQLPNFYRVLKKNEIDYEIITAGEFKRTLTQFGEITQKAREKVQEDVDVMHQLFKNWVKEHRPSVDIDKIATGETWVGKQSLELNMVDALGTSDECILNLCEEADVFEVEFEIKKSIQDKLGAVLETSIGRVITQWIERSSPNKFQ